jgi:hypothetical protein
VLTLLRHGALTMAKPGISLPPLALGPLQISASLARTLERVRRARAITAPPLRHVEDVAAAESQIESVIPNDVLACSAALDLPLSGIVDMSGALDSSLADGRASRRTSGHPYPFFPLDRDGITQVCFAGGRDRAATTISVWDLRKGCLLSPYPREAPFADVESVLRWLYSGKLGEPKIDFRRRTEDALVIEIRERPMPAKKRVRHPKFGVGTVLEEDGDALRVDFGGSIKKLARSFVVPLDGS